MQHERRLVLAGEACALTYAIIGATQARARADAQEARLYADLWQVCATRVGDLRGEAFHQALDLELRTLAMEIGIATNLSDRSIVRRFSDAYALVHHFPTVLRALEGGHITMRHANVITTEIEPLSDPAICEEYLERAIEIAKTTTPARLERRARRLAAELDRNAAAERFELERRRRSIELTDLSNGMSQLRAYLPSPVAHAIHDRLTELAKSNRDVDTFGSPVDSRDAAPCPICRDGFVRTDSTARAILAATNPDADEQWAVCPNCIGGVEPGIGPGRRGLRAEPEPPVGGSADARPFDAVRADAFADLLLAGTLPEDSRHAGINSIQGKVAITVPALALAGATNELAMHDGVGPIDLDLAMQLTAGATIWQRVITDAVTGIPITADRYRPPAALARFIETRDQHCRAPGCRRAAHRCDLDHTQAFAEGGRTTADNLAALCRYHHVAKHHDWEVTQGDNGQLTWRSPTGLTHIDTPQPLGTPMAPSEVRELINGGAPPRRLWPRTRGDAPPSDSGPTFLPKAA